MEHVLDLFLADMLKRGKGAVRMVFEADEDDHLPIDLSCAGIRQVTAKHADLPITQARRGRTTQRNHDPRHDILSAGFRRCEDAE